MVAGAENEKCWAELRAKAAELNIIVLDSMMKDACDADPELQSIRTSIGRIDSAVLKFIKKYYNPLFYFASKSITELPQYASIEDQFPRGYPPGSSYKDVRGVASPFSVVVSRVAVVEDRSEVKRNVVIHELGHAFDYAVGKFFSLDISFLAVSQSREFLEIHRSSKWSLPYYNDFPEEAFAYLFQEYFVSESSRQELKRDYPKGFSFLEKILNLKHLAANFEYSQPKTLASAEYTQKVFSLKDARRMIDRYLWESRPELKANNKSNDQLLAEIQREYARLSGSEASAKISTDLIRDSFAKQNLTKTQKILGLLNTLDSLRKLEASKSGKMQLKNPRYTEEQYYEKIKAYYFSILDPQNADSTWKGIQETYLKMDATNRLIALDAMWSEIEKQKKK